MGQKEKIYELDKKIESVLRRIKEANISNRNKSLILKFYNHCFSEGLSKLRIEFYLNRLKVLAEDFKKDFDKANKNDIEWLVGKIERKDYTTWTKHDYKVTIKKFYKWLRKTEDYPKEVKWITTTVKNEANQLPEELLTREEINKMIKTAKNPRDKALISILYESGCRIGELLGLKIKNVSFDKYGAKLIVNGKTGMRRVRLISSVHYLTEWLENHPYSENPESPLWITLATNNRGNLLKYRRVSEILKTIAKEVGIRKKIYPHLFRHSRATYLANHLTEAQMCEYFGWVQGSDMPGTYVHLSGRDVDKALLKMQGIIEEERKDNIIICPRCRNENLERFKFCRECGMPLTIDIALKQEEERSKYDKIMSKLLEQYIKDPEFKKKAIKIIKELSQNN